MTAPAYFTWDFTLSPLRAARAASIGDLGDSALVDDAVYPPVPPEMPYSAQLNQWSNQLGGVNRVILACDIEVQFFGGVPKIVNVQAMSSIITTAYAIANFAVGLISAGRVNISWATGTLPPPRAKPRAWVTDNSAAIPQPVAIPTVVAGNPGVEVDTWNLAGMATNLNFVVSVY